MKKLLGTLTGVAVFAATGLVGIGTPAARSDASCADAHYTLRTTAAPYQWVQACTFPQAVRDAAILLARTPAYGSVTIDHVSPGTGDGGSK